MTGNRNIPCVPVAHTIPPPVHLGVRLPWMKPYNLTHLPPGKQVRGIRLALFLSKTGIFQYLVHTAKTEIFDEVSESVFELVQVIVMPES